MSYNGWTNYETWAVNLWLDNDQGSYEYWHEIAQEYFEGANYDTESAAWNMADMLKQSHEDMNPLGDQASAYSDLLGAALSEVNWHEIARHYITDCEVAA